MLVSLSRRSLRRVPPPGAAHRALAQPVLRDICSVDTCVPVAAGVRRGYAQLPRAPPNPHESFLGGNNANYAEAMWSSWKADKASVHVSWQAFFEEMEAGRGPGMAIFTPPTIRGGHSGLDHAHTESLKASLGAAGGGAVSASQDMGAGSDLLKISALVRAYQVSGHRVAKLDPLGILDADLDGSTPKELDLSYYGFTAADLERKWAIGDQEGMTGFMGSSSKEFTLRQLHDRLNEVYSGHIGFEYMHITNREMCNWIRDRIETPVRPELTKEQRLRMLDRLCWSDHFERFLATKFPSAKRFGLEGAESLIPGLKELIDSASDKGVESIVIGMPHRGRLNVLANVVRKPIERIFNEFSGAGDKENYEGSGDVKYHLGMSFDRPTTSGKMIHLSLVANPSHLETVDPVVQGKVRAAQFYMNDKERKKVMPLLMHGDAAFSGQGVCYETQGLSDLSNYTTGGTVHVVVNNQIGFTTDPRFSRSSPYCTDLAKAIDAPIFHVNGDDVEAVCSVFKLAAEWRQTWGKDVVVDLVCYRKHGHNEIDNPSFTQPKMYQHIAKKTSILKGYQEQLAGSGVLSEEEIKGVSDNVMRLLNEGFAAAPEYKAKKGDWLEGVWENFRSPREHGHIHETGAKMEDLQLVGKALYTIPERFNVHSVLRKQLENKRKMFESGEGIDWGTGESLAYGTLLAEGFHVRISGQDVERGTFSHRNAVLNDQVDETRYVPLNNIKPGQAEFHACNSSLSEYGVLGFELGYSMHNPNSLVIWEAQFGDFANTAQVMIDTYIASGESKWGRQAGLVMLLPHGYDGQGPEHSSARLERFLQMCDDDPHQIPDFDPEVRMQIQKSNWQVVNPTTPANFFHVIRRQIHREFRKPLIVMSPKALLRDKLCVSKLEDFDDVGKGTRFQRVLHDEVITPGPDARKLIFCSGKVYYDLAREREAKGIKDVAIARLEQIAPFPFDKVQEERQRFPNAEILFVQEEPKNMGAYSYCEDRIETAVGVSPQYVGRACAASPATGSNAQHHIEQAEIIAKAFA